MSASFLSALHTGEGFGSTPLPPVISLREQRSCRSASAAAASFGDENNSGAQSGSEFSKPLSLQEKIDEIGATYLDSLSSDLPDAYEEAMARKKQIVLENGQPNFQYEIALPISKAAQDTTAMKYLGVTLSEVGTGPISAKVLDLDSLQYLASVEETELRVAANANAGEKGTGSIQYLDEAMRDVVEDDTFRGVVVSSVVRGGIAWNAGVRAGDMLMATSATMGQRLWPKSTLDGVRSAISSRKVMSPDMKFQFQRSGAQISATQVVEEFELSLTRPMGIHVEDTEAGYVRISGFTDNPLSIVEKALRVGDRIVAVDSSLGDVMWPVSSVEGIVSACTSRLPGKPVKLRFERVVEVGKYTAAPTEESGSTSVESVAPSLTSAVDGFRKLKEDVAESPTQAASIASTGSNTHKILLSRCRDVLRRYSSQAGAKYNDKFSVPGLVADRVLEALADASAPLDGKTLSLIMNAYISCKKPDSAIKAFEAAVGLSADGSTAVPDVVIQGRKTEGSQIVADTSALTLYTATALLRAHALRGDVLSARRVLAAMERRADFVVNGVGAAAWPGTAETGPIAVDVMSYNIALAAAAKAGGEKGIQMAVELFEEMAEPKSREDGRAPAKNIVSYNTMISLFAKSKRSQDAFTVFYSMKQAGMKPDKFTYTSLINACVNEVDVQELLYDMQEEGIEADLITYNSVIKSLCDRYKFFEAKKLVTDMEMRGIYPDSMTYGLIMNGLLKANKPGPCLTLFETACADEQTTALTENVQLYTTAITAASALGDHERALDLVSRMNIVGVKPNMKTLTALLGACLSSDKADYAVEVFKKIGTPDGYAMAMGIKAYCAAGDHASACSILSEQRDGFHEMSGKEIMESYNFLISSALKQRNYAVARDSLTQLLSSGYIPSKTTLWSMVEALDLLPKKREFVSFVEQASVRTEDSDKFDFMLFVLDSMGARKLRCSGFFYSSILFEGARLGGLRKKVSSMLAKARAATDAKGDQIHVDVATGPTNEGILVNWETLVNEYSHYRDRIEDVLPTLRVQVGSREIRQVLAAEQAVTYGMRRTRTVSGKQRRN